MGQVANNLMSNIQDIWYKSEGELGRSQGNVGEKALKYNYTIYNYGIYYILLYN